MNKISMALIALMSVIMVAPAANAKGCIKGAVVGGAAGHCVGSGHGLLGAAAGCLVGRHYANKQWTNNNTKISTQRLRATDQ